jgi:hypothetical protein
MNNYWLDRASETIEKEVILVKNSKETKMWYNKMSILIPIIAPLHKPQQPGDFVPQVGVAHNLKLSRHGIEAVLKTSRKYQRFSFYVLHDKINQPLEPFWVVLLNQD